jgi:hypothetical protein
MHHTNLEPSKQIHGCEQMLPRISAVSVLHPKPVAYLILNCRPGTRGMGSPGTMGVSVSECPNPLESRALFRGRAPPTVPG